MAHRTPFEVDTAEDYVRSTVLEPVIIITAANWIFIIINFHVIWMTFTSKDSTCSYLPTSTSRSVVNYVKAFNGRISLLMINWVVITACQIPPTGHYWCCCHKFPCTFKVSLFQRIKRVYLIKSDTRKKYSPNCHRCFLIFCKEGVVYIPEYSLVGCLYAVN